MNAFALATRPYTLIALALLVALGACRKEAEQEAAAPAAATTAVPAAAATTTSAGDLDFKPAEGALEATEENIEKAKSQTGEAAKAARDKWRGKTFEEFESTVYKEPGPDGKYIVSGDIAIADRKQLRDFFDKMLHEDDETAHGKLTGALTVNTVNGGVDIWSSARKKQLTYCVSDAFGPHKAQVVADMTAATGAWEEAADVDFTHVAAQDANCTATNQNVLFDVRPVDVGGEYLARAYFPNDQRRDRNVLIDNSSFDMDPADTLKLVGILRHELGHVLGWRHEHTRPEAGMCFEDNNFQPITGYDSFSVMHYPQCNGGGDWSLVLTGLDKAGAACMYGKGTQNNENLNQCTYHAPTAPATGTQETVVIDDQSVLKDKRNKYGPYTVKPGSIAMVKMTGVGTDAGDPDLYVRVQLPLDLTAYNCRPYTSGANETCELEIPSNRSKLHVMVHGYTAAHYKLEITYTKP